MPRRVAIVGPGRVGTLLGLALPRAGHRVVAVAGGGADSRDRFTDRVAGVRAYQDPVEAVATADLVVVATPDGAIAGVVRDLAAAGAVTEDMRVVHLAGSLGLEPLRPAALAGAGVAAIHPAQTVPSDAGADALVGAAWAVTAPPADREWAKDLVGDLGGDAFEVADEDRVLYHAGLVLGSNAVAAATVAARLLLIGAGVDDPAAFLAGLAHRSVDNVLAEGAAALTGPVVRGDDATLRAHLEALDADLPELASTYRHLQRAVLDRARLSLDPELAARLAAALDDA